MKRWGIKVLCIAIALGLSGFSGIALAEGNGTPVKSNSVVTKEAGAAEKGSATAAKGSLPSALGTTSDTTDGAQGKVHLNSASAAQLSEQLLGIGLKKAEAIVSFRETHGPFTQLEQLLEVPGIGAGLIERNQARLAL